MSAAFLHFSARKVEANLGACQNSGGMAPSGLIQMSLIISMAGRQGAYKQHKTFKKLFFLGIMGLSPYTTARTQGYGLYLWMLSRLTTITKSMLRTTVAGALN